MRKAFAAFRGRDLPLIGSRGGRRRGLDLREIERAGARPDIVLQYRGGDLRTSMIEDAQRSAAQSAAGRALDADVEGKSFYGRNGGWRAPGVHMRGMGQCRKGEGGRSFFMQDSLRLTA